MRLKDCIKQHRRIIGTCINLSDAAISHIAAMAGFDYVWIDLEHGSMSLERLPEHILAIRSAGAAAVVRVPENDLTFTKKVIDMGVDGIVFPRVRTAKQAAELMSYTLYPPHGTRGFGPIGAVRYGFDSAADYVKRTDSVCRFIQIEDVETVHNLDEIMENPWIDGYIFGANDLSGSINELLDVFGKNTTELIQECIRKLRAQDKYIGLFIGDTDEQILSRWEKMDFEMLSAGADFKFLHDASRELCERMSQIFKPQKTDN